MKVLSPIKRSLRVLGKGSFAFLMLGVLSACAQSALIRSQHEIAALKDKLPAQEAELHRLQSETAALDAETAALSKELEKSQLDLDALTQKLDKLNKEIARESHASNEARRRLAQLRKKTQRLRDEAKWQQNAGPEQSDYERRKAELRQEIRTFLELGLH